MTKKDGKIQIAMNGPYIVTGEISLDESLIKLNKEGESESWQKTGKLKDKGPYSLCRCGKSKNIPFCDGTHKNTRFDGTETAKNIPYNELAAQIVGETLILHDVVDYCACARFCDRAGDAWNNTLKSHDQKARSIAIQETCDCPSGRLVIQDRQSGKLIEPNFDLSVSVVRDPQADMKGPLWIKGGIPIFSSKDDTSYEIRNRVTLCRCGKSKNKPFCDCSHMEPD